MKSVIYTLASFAALSFLPILAQGSLTPPAGPPAPVMKTLDQVEPRIPLVDSQPGVSIDGLGTISISQPGSYYLTENLKITDAAAHGIKVLTSSVSIDLNGYSLLCTTVNGGDAIHISGASYVQIRNGIIRGATEFGGSSFSPLGWENGVNATAAKPGLVVSNLNVSGTRASGISLNDGPSRVERCVVSTTAGIGIYATQVIDSTATDAGLTAIFTPSAASSAVVRNCIGESVLGAGHGISAVNGSVSNSQGKADSGNGISALVALNCSGVSSSGNGISSSGNVNNCYGSSSSGTGISAVNAANSYGKTDGAGLAINLGAIGTASYCRAVNNGGGPVMKCYIAVACNKSGGSINTLGSKELGTP